MSMPIMVIPIVGNSPLCRFSRPAFWHIDAAGGRPPHQQEFRTYGEPNALKSLSAAGLGPSVRYGSKPAAPLGGYGLRGSRIVNSLYSPTLLSTVMLPPCCCVTMS